MIQKADKESTKRTNRQNIVNVFFRRDLVSKADVIAATKLSAAAVNNLIQELVDEGILVEKSYGESSGGRRPQLYSLDPGLYCVLSLRVTTKSVVASAMDLTGEELASKTVVAGIHDRASFEDAVGAAFDAFREQRPDVAAKVKAVAFSVPGVIDYTRAVVTFSSALYVEALDLRELARRLFRPDVAVHAFKDTDALLLGEFHCGPSNCGSMAYLLCEAGVGLSVMSRGKLYLADDCGMEIGHTVVDMRGKKCKCGNRGCLSTLLGEERAIERYLELGGGVGEDAASLGYEVLAARSQDGDEAALRAVDEQLELLGLAVANVVNLFNPDEIALGGPLAKFAFAEAAIDRLARSRALAPFAKKLAIRRSTLNANACMRGMTYTVLQREFFRASKP